MQSELARRETVERRYGLSPDPSPNSVEPVASHSLRILAAGDFGAEGDVLDRVAGDDIQLSMVEELGQGQYEVAVVAVNGEAEQWLTMCSDIRDNPRLFNLPILMVADADSFSDPEAPFRQGATDLQQRPVDAAKLRAHMDMLIKQQRFCGRMQNAYGRSLHIETSDSLTGLYNFGFLHDYPAELITDAHRWQRPVSVGMFDITHMDAINQRLGYAAGDRLLRQVGSLVGRLVRGEDLTARFDGEEFCVVMPETPSDAGAQVLRRIADVAMMTEFGIVMDETPITVGVKLGCTGLETGDTSETLLARARNALR